MFFNGFLGYGGTRGTRAIIKRIYSRMLFSPFMSNDSKEPMLWSGKTKKIALDNLQERGRGKMEMEGGERRMGKERERERERERVGGREGSEVRLS